MKPSQGFRGIAAAIHSCSPNSHARVIGTAEAMQTPQTKTASMRQSIAKYTQFKLTLRKKPISESNAKSGSNYHHNTNPEKPLTRQRTNQHSNHSAGKCSYRNGEKYCSPTL
jgi:hypothetical protein